MIAGRQKAKVFPDPVNAIPIMSLPENLRDTRQENPKKTTVHFNSRRRDALYLNWCGFDDLVFPQVLDDTSWYFHILWKRMRKGSRIERIGTHDKRLDGGRNIFALDDNVVLLADLN